MGLVAVSEAVLELGLGLGFSIGLGGRRGLVFLVQTWVLIVFCLDASQRAFNLCCKVVRGRCSAVLDSSEAKASEAKASEASGAGLKADMAFKQVKY